MPYIGILKGSGQLLGLQPVLLAVRIWFVLMLRISSLYYGVIWGSQLITIQIYVVFFLQYIICGIRSEYCGVQPVLCNSDQRVAFYIL